MEITPKDLAALTGGTVEGDENIALTGFAKIEEAGAGDLSFIANPKYEHFAQTTKAGALLVGKEFNPGGECKATLIRVEDPYSTLAQLMRYVESLKPSPEGIEQPSYISAGVVIPEKCYIGAFAYIGKGARLGRNVKIYPQAYIGEGVEIGDDSIIRAGVKIYEGCRIGRRCIIHSGCVIGADGFGFAPENGKYKKIPQTGIVVIEDDVEIGANTTVDRATFGQTVVGEGTKLDNLIQVAHNVTIGKNNVFASQTGIAGSVHIGDGNMVGGQCGFAGHITVGNYNEIGAQSGIPKSVGDRKRLMGYPAVDYLQFAKNQVYIKNLGKMYEEIKKLKQ
ncbi:MAG: UDP-3-O-(3-hydroxymyristoyl)glucosamine N-acyltransferase [Muribaculaceae bacterium]|nr:UDP-3-O-(3-hydroxymyristoyl)glucosamine N-acyltransferase [Muribaculaceae bacterium]